MRQSHPAALAASTARTTSLIPLLVLITIASIATSALAGPREQARRMFDRLNGAPPAAADLDAMQALIEAGDLRGAALHAIDTEEGWFYNVILRDMISPWTNENEYVRVDLNDYTATVIGMVRDEIPFNGILSKDIVYVGVSPDTDEPLPPYSIGLENIEGDDGNAHYQEIQERNLPLHKILTRRTQSEETYLTEDAASGILTTRGFARGYYDGGTNRVAARFVFKTFLCRDIEALLDTSRPDFRVRRDVSRQPGGDSATYKNKCSGCHSGMDGHAGAFAYLDWDDEDEGLVYNPLGPREKYNRNANEFPQGFVTENDSWINLWALGGPNQKLGWNGATSGNGAKTWGTMITQTDAFASCMAERALVKVCDVDPATDDAQLAIRQLAAGFKAEGKYNMKHLFARAAVLCRGE